MTGIALSVNPLINDYVQKGSRGKANALYNLGYLFGDLFNYLVLLQIFQGFSIGKQFQAAGITVMLITCALVFMIKEPVIFKTKNKSNLLYTSI